MPKEAQPKDKPQRWEGTHLYNRGTFQQRRRTVAQVHEDLARAKGEREKNKISANTTRRNSLPAASGIGPRPRPASERRDPPVLEGSPRDDIEEVFFDASYSPPSPPVQPAEEMPGSNKKKRNASGGVKPPDPTSNPTGEGIDPCLKGFLLSIKEELQTATRDAAEKVRESMDKRLTENERSIRELRTRLDDRDKDIDDRIAAQITKLVPIKPPAVRSPGLDRRERAYHFSRRSLKLWPVEGEDLEDAVRVFLRSELKLLDQKIGSLGVIEVTVGTGRSARDRKEVLATFETKEDRDAVKAAGINLAGKDSVSMSIHVPGHLLDNYFALNSVGYSIKSKHQGVKRAVKFDDNAQNVYLDIYVGGQWKKITPEDARAVQKKLPQASNLSGNLSPDTLADLVQGNPVQGLTAVVVPADDTDQ